MWYIASGPVLCSIPDKPRSKFPAVSLTKSKSSFLFLLHPLAGRIANQINPIIDWLFDLC